MTRSRSGRTQDPTRSAALVAGVLYLVTFVIGIPPALMLAPVLGDPLWVTGTGSDASVTLASLFDIVNALACIGTAVALFPIVKRQSESFALGFVTTRIYEAAVIMVGVLGILALVTLRETGAANGDTAALVPVGQSLVAVRDWSFILGPGLAPALNALLLGTLMYRSRLVPRILPVLGLIGAPLLLSSTTGTMFGVNEVASAWTGIATVPIFCWELFLGLWMTFKGFNRQAPIVAAAIAEAESTVPGATPPASSLAAVAEGGAA